VAELVADAEVFGEVDRVLGVAELVLAVGVETRRAWEVEVVASGFLGEGDLAVLGSGDLVGEGGDLLGDVGDAVGVGDVGEDGLAWKYG